MILIDLSRDIEHKMAVLPNHPQVIVTPFATHDEVRVADGYGFSSATVALVMGDHAGTHVDAPKHFNADPGAMPIDQVPLENFFTEAVCLDLSHKPLKSDISIDDLEKAEVAAGVTIKPKDTVLLHMDFFRRTHGTPGFITDFPGLTKESATRAEGHRHVRRRGGQPRTAGPQQFRGSSRLPRSRLHAHGGPGQSRQACRQGPLPLHRLPDQDQGRHRRPDPRGGVAGRLNCARGTAFCYREL
jgi:kynurenine formamidase